VKGNPCIRERAGGVAGGVAGSIARSVAGSVANEGGLALQLSHPRGTSNIDADRAFYATLTVD